MKNSEKRSRDFEKAKTFLKDILSGAECYQSQSMDIHNRYLDMRKIFNLPQWCWRWMDGYYACRSDAWYRYNLVYCLVWQGTPIDMKWDNLTEEQKEYCRKTSSENMNSGHYWKNKDGSIGRLFFSSFKG